MIETSNLPAILAAVVALLAAITALVVALRKTGPEVANITSDTAIDLGRRLQELETAAIERSRRMEELALALDAERKVRQGLEASFAAVKLMLAKVQFELSVYKAGTNLLIAQVEAAGMVAAWHPPE